MVEDRPTALAQILWEKRLRLAPGKWLVWDVIDRVADHVPELTVGELRRALCLFLERVEESERSAQGMATVFGPEAMQ